MAGGNLLGNPIAGAHAAKREVCRVDEPAIVTHPSYVFATTLDGMMKWRVSDALFRQGSLHRLVMPMLDLQGEEAASPAGELAGEQLARRGRALDAVLMRRPQGTASCSSTRSRARRPQGICNAPERHNYTGHNYISHNSLGHNYAGRSHVGNNFVGNTYVGNTYVGHNYMDHGNISHEYVWHNYIGHRYIGHNYLSNGSTARNCLRHDYIGQSYIGHNHIGHSYIRHNHIGHSTYAITI